MKITNTEIVISAVRQSQYPEPNFPEFLVVGRSNVGKSSFVNTIINRKNYARVSTHPGKTQTLNFYLVNNEFYLVDVPGYGYARVGEDKRKKFGLMIEEYLETRTNLKEVFLLIDFRHLPTEDDLLMYDFLKYHQKKVTIIATKVDKISPSKREKQKKNILDAIDLVVGDEFILYSSVSKEGKKETHDRIETYLDFIDIE